MEFCQLGDLATFVKKRDKLSTHPVTIEMVRSYPNPLGAGFNEVVVRHFAKQLASALEFLRSRNLVHRDLKPQNLLLNPPPGWIARAPHETRPFAVSKDSLVPSTGLESLPFLKIADFGFARHLPTTTMAETLCGSPLYMAPEILRYEKYDAKADLWSVGTVLYELMVGKPPFRAANHVDLLRKIEKAEDKIKFPDDLEISPEMKKVIRALLKRMPTERPSWDAFFRSEIIVGEIPGLVSADRRQPSAKEITPLRRESGAPDSGSVQPGPSDVKRAQQRLTPRSSFDRPGYNTSQEPPQTPRQEPLRQRRPSLVSHATAPALQGTRNDRGQPPPIERRVSQKPPSPSTSVPKDGWERDRATQRNQDRLAREARERAAQDAAFERDYVMVEKRAVEVNAFADELAANQQMNRGTRDEHPQPGAMVRRATTQGSPTSNPSAQANQARQMQVALRPESAHQRRPSLYERRYGPNKTSATSALAAALNMVNFRFGNGALAPVLGKGPSPPQGHGPFPAFPATQPMPLLLGDSVKPAKMDEDHRILSTMEDSATRSDVVYGFAEVKYKQLIPIAPSNDNKLGIRIFDAQDGQVNAEGDDDDLTADAVVGISEEALVLYVKALAILTNTINFAGTWWTGKRRGEVVGEVSSSPKSLDSGKASLASVGGRINGVVQWARNRFNECLEKSEFVSRKLVESQKKLPSHHTGHPSNHPRDYDGEQHQDIAGSLINLSSGITAEKLMYDRAVEMSKSAAMSELLSHDLPGCEVSYLTAVRLLEAVLEKHEEPGAKKGDNAKEKDKEKEGANEDSEDSDQLEEGDRNTVIKRECSASCVNLIKTNQAMIVIEHVRQRLHVLRKKITMANANKRHSQQKNASPPPEPANMHGGTPASAPTAPAGMSPRS